MFSRKGKSFEKPSAFSQACSLKFSAMFSAMFSATFLLFLSLQTSCSNETAEQLPVGLSFAGVDRVEPAVDGMWRVIWTPVVAVDNAFYAVFEREESGGIFNFNEPLARTKQQFFLTTDLRLMGSRCYTVRAVVNEKIISSRDNQVCTGHKAFQFSGLEEVKPLEKGNYLLSWPLTPFDGNEMAFEVSERYKGETVWNVAGNTAESFFPTRLISIEEVVCFNVRYLHNGLPKDTNAREICTDEESTGNFVGIKGIKRATPNDPLGGYIIDWERSVREDVVAYRVYMGADFKKVVGEVSGKESTYRIKGLEVGATYEFGVRLLTKGGREDGNKKKMRIAIENDIPVVTAVDLRGVRRVDPETGESKVSSIRCTADFVDPDRSSARVFPKIEFKARLATGERPIVLRQRQVMAAVTLDDRGRGTVSSEYQIDPAKDRRGNDLFCEATVFDGLDPSATVPSQFVFLPDSPGIATGMFISKKIFFDPKEGSTHYFDAAAGGEPAQLIMKPDGTRANHSCMVASTEGSVQNTETLDICEDTTVEMIIKRVRVPEELEKAGKEAELAAFENKMVYQEGALGDDYKAFFNDVSNRAKLGYWDPDAGDLASAIQFREVHNGTIAASRCLEGVCEISFKLAENFASGSSFGAVNADGQRLVHAQFEYRVRTYDPGALEGFDINGTPVDEIGWSNWAVAKIDVTGVDEQPRNTGVTVLGFEDRVQKVVFCNDLNNNPNCALDKQIEVDPNPLDPMLKYLSGKGYGYFDLEDDPPVRVLPQSQVDLTKGEWVKPKQGIAVPDINKSADWETVVVPLSAATSCDQTAEYCPFKCSRVEKQCYGYFRPAVDRTGDIDLVYDVWVEIDLTTNPDAQYFGKSNAERQVKSLESGNLKIKLAALNDKADIPEISTTLWREDEVDGTPHQIKLVPETGYVDDVQQPNEVKYYDPDGDLLRRATDIEVRFWEGGQLKTSYCKSADDERSFSGAAASDLRASASYPGVRGVTTANCQMDIGNVIYRPTPPSVDADIEAGIAYRAKIQWTCDGFGNCSGNLLLPEHYNYFLGDKAIEFDYRIRATRLDTGSSSAVRTLADDWTSWKPVSLKIQPEPDGPMVHTISLGGEDSNRSAISEDTNFVVRLTRGRGVARNLTVSGGTPEAQRHYDVYFDVDETNDVAHTVTLVEIYKKDGIPVIFDKDGNDISQNLPNSSLFTCDAEGVCAAELKAAENFFTPDGVDAFFKLQVETWPKDPAMRQANNRASDPTLPGRVSFTIASIDDAPSTGGAGVMSGIPEDETYQVIFKKNPAADEFGYFEIEAGDLAEKVEFSSIQYYDPFYFDNTTLVQNAFPDPIRRKSGEALGFIYGPALGLSGLHGFPGNGNNTSFLNDAPSVSAINRASGLSKRLIVRGEYFATEGGASPTLVPDINVNNYLLPASGDLPERYQYVCRRFSGSGMQAGQCKVEIRSPLHFNTDNPGMSGRTASMSYRVYTRDPNRWRSPYPPGQTTPVGGNADEANGKWSDWKHVDLLFSPVNDPPFLISPLSNDLLTWEKDFGGPGIDGANLKGGPTGNNTTTNRVHMIEDTENKLYFRWRKSYFDTDYHTETFTFNFDRATLTGDWSSGSFSNARRFLGTKLSVNLDAIKTVFWGAGQPSLRNTVTNCSGAGLCSESPNPLWNDNIEVVNNGNSISRTRSFGSEVRETGFVSLAVNSSVILTHNLSKDLNELKFYAQYEDDSDPPQKIFLTKREVQSNFSITQISNDELNIVRTGNSLFSGGTFGDVLNLRVAAIGWNSGNPGDFYGPPATNGAVSSSTNINCDDSNGDCIFYFQPPDNFFGTVDATVRIADGNPFPQSTDWNDELNAQKLYIRAENKDDLPEIVVPEVVFDLFENEAGYIRFGRLSNGTTDCTKYEAGFGNPGETGGLYPGQVFVTSQAHPYDKCPGVSLPRGVQDSWALSPPVYPAGGCAILAVTGGYPIAQSLPNPVIPAFANTFCKVGTFFYTFLDADRRELTAIDITGIHSTPSPRFEMHAFPGSPGAPDRRGDPLGVGRVLMGDAKFLRLDASSGSANGVYNVGATTGRPYTYVGDPALGDSYFTYRVKTDNDLPGVTNTIDCTDPAACFSNEGRVYVRIHGTDESMAANNSVATTVNGTAVNVAAIVTADEDQAVTLSVLPSYYSDRDNNPAPHDKAVGIKICANDVVDLNQSKNLPGLFSASVAAQYDYWEDFDNAVFEWSPDFEYRETHQAVLQGTMADDKMNHRSHLIFDTVGSSGGTQPNYVRVSSGALALNGGVPQPYRPSPLISSTAVTGLTENNGLSSACSLTGTTPTGTCSMQVRPQLKINGEFLLCVHVKSFAKAGDKFTKAAQWSDPIYFKVVVNPVDDPPRIAQLPVRARGNEDHPVLVEVRPGKFEWNINRDYNYSQQVVVAGSSGQSKISYVPKDAYTAVRPGYWDYDSNMGSGSPDLAEFLYVNMASVPGVVETGIGNGAIAHSADPDAPTPVYDVPCSSGSPASNICKIKCKADGVCLFRFTPPLNNGSDFKLQYWVQAKGGKKLSSRLADNTQAERGADASYALYEDMGIYDNYPYHQCLNESAFKLDLWRYALEEPRMTGAWGDDALHPVTDYGSGINYYDQKNPPPVSRQLPNFYGESDTRNLVPMLASGGLSSMVVFIIDFKPFWLGPGINSKLGSAGKPADEWNPVWPGLPDFKDLTQAMVTNYMTNQIVHVDTVTQNPSSSIASVINPPPFFVKTTQRVLGTGEYARGSYFSGTLGSYTKNYAQNPKIIYRNPPQGPPAGTNVSGDIGGAGCEQQQTGYIRIEIDSVPDKPSTPAFINRTISGRLANEIYIGNSTNDTAKDGYVDGDGESASRFAILGESPASPQWSITASPTPPSAPVGLTLLERFPASGVPADGSPVRYFINSVGFNASGPQGCNPGGGFCKFYFHPAPGYTGNLNLNYTVTTGSDAWESDDGVNPLVCAGAAFGKTCVDNAPGQLRLSVVSNAPTITLPGAGQPFQVTEDGGPQPLRLNGSATQAQFMVDEGGGAEQDPERVVVWFSGCDETVIKCANISFDRTDAPYGSLVSPANNMGAANATITVVPELNRFTAATMNVIMHAEEYDSAGNPTGYETTRTIPIQVVSAEDAPTISTNPLSSPAYVANEDANIVISNVAVDEGGGVQEDGQQVTVSFVSADQSIVPNGNIVLSPADESGGGAAGDAGAITNRTITVTPAAGANTTVGGIKITMSVADGVSAPTTRDFYVQFNAVDDPPVLTSAVPLLAGAHEYKAAQLTPLLIPAITIDEGGNPTGNGNEDSQVVTVQFLSSDTGVINPDTDVSLSGASDTSGTNSNAISRDLTITPSGFGQDVLLTMRVSDGAHQVDYVMHIDVAKPPLGPLDCTDSGETNPDQFIVGASQTVPAITCSGLTAASAPGTGTATYEIAAGSSCSNMNLATNNGAGSTMTLGGTMSIADCTLTVSGNDQGTPQAKVPPAQRKTLNFLLAKVDDLAFSNAQLNGACALSVDMSVSYFGGRSTYSSSEVETAAGGMGGTSAFGTLGVTSNKVTGVLSDFTKTSDALDVTVSDSKGTSRTEALSLNISKTAVTALAVPHPLATVSGTFGSGKQVKAAYGSACVNSATCELAAPALVAAGRTHTCALNSAGLLHCFGENDSDGKLGLNSVVADDFEVPEDLEAITPAVAGVRVLTAGRNHSCAVTNSGKLFCWGDNSEEQLATGAATTHYAVPTQLVASGVASVAVGNLHTCYLGTNGRVNCAGRNDRGQLGNGTNTDSSTWVDVGFSDAVAIAAAGDNTCALTGTAGSRSLFCWGDNNTSQLGNSLAPSTPGPSAYSAAAVSVDAIAASNLNKAVELAMGGDTGTGQVCVITSDGGVTDSGTLRCFGNNSSGQLAKDPATLTKTSGAANSAQSPTLPSNPAVVGVSMGVNHTCVITEHRKLFCYGEQSFGRLGNALTTGATVHTPAEVTTLTTAGVVAVSAGSEHTCAATANGRLHCFGNGSNGRLGDGLTAHRGTPYDLNSNAIPFQSALRTCYSFNVTLP